MSQNNIRTVFRVTDSHDTILQNCINPSYSSSPEYAAILSSRKLIVCRQNSDIETQVKTVFTHAESVVEMAAQYDPYAQETFDLSRLYILSCPTPPFRIADARTNSTTRSTYRLHWNWLALWDNFGACVHQYWTQVVPQADKQRNVYTQQAHRNAVQGIVNNSRVSNEGNVKVCIDRYVVDVHTAAANGLNGAARPTDQHSILQRWEQGVEGNQVAGVPDYVMATEYGNPPRRLTALLEVKNPWKVTPALIDAVIDSSIQFSPPLI